MAGRVEQCCSVRDAAESPTSGTEMLLLLLHVFCGSETEAAALCMLGRCSTTGFYPQEKRGFLERDVETYIQILSCFLVKYT